MPKVSSSATIPSAATPSVAGRARADRRLVGLWLVAMAALIALMVTVGGATRLTDSGLSITEWRPVTGAIPPLSEAAWQAELEKYRQIPEYQLQNKGMSLEAFKRIYWWEWGHRLLGRIIGIAFAVPLVFFLVTRRIERTLALPLAGLFVLGGLQGFIGWYMVSSGLVDRLDVSQYRLAMHLGLAFLIFALIVWIARGLTTDAPRKAAPELRPLLHGAAALAGLVFAQAVYGAFVAGLDAGYLFNDWPLMEGALVPAGLVPEGAASVFEDRLTVQFTHRLIAYGIVLAALFYVWRLHRSAAPLRIKQIGYLALGAVGLQVVLGILTVVHAVPLPLGLAHQLGALALLALTVILARDLQRLVTAPAAAASPAARPAEI